MICLVESQFPSRPVLACERRSVDQTTEKGSCRKVDIRQAAPPVDFHFSLVSTLCVFRTVLGTRDNP